MRERLLAMHVLAHLHRLRGHHRVVVIGHADRHGVDAVAHLVEHLAEVGEVVLGLVGLVHAFEDRRIDVAQRDRSCRSFDMFATSLWPLPPTPMQPT